MPLCPCVQGESWGQSLCLSWGCATNCCGQLPRLGLSGLSLTSQNEAAQCSMSHIHTVCWQREHVLISWECQGNTSPAQAPQKGTDQDNPRLLPALEQ